MTVPPKRNRSAGIHDLQVRLAARPDRTPQENPCACSWGAPNRPRGDTSCPRAKDTRGSATAGTRRCGPAARQRGARATAPHHRAHAGPDEHLHAHRRRSLAVRPRALNTPPTTPRTTARSVRAQRPTQLALTPRTERQHEQPVINGHLVIEHTDQEQVIEVDEIAAARTAATFTRRSTRRRRGGHDGRAAARGAMPACWSHTVLKGVGAHPCTTHARPDRHSTAPCGTLKRSQRE
ncbi:MAG: hypothetical protein JWR05_3683 [Mucilaginibacter sp.]|jgi:hypothetical protein|nr:hypothetical protein [Mucilaginibacter sp.]